MSCILHISGETVDVGQLTRLSPFEPCSIFRKGEPRSNRANARVAGISGVNLVVSSADFEEFEKQQSEAIEFLETHMAALKEMSGTVGVERVSLDFGIAMRSVVVQSDEFQPALILLVAELNCGLMLSQYPVGKKSKNLGRYRKALRGGA